MLTDIDSELRRNRKAWIALAVVLGFSLLILSSSFLGYAYNNHVFALGRLAHSIEIGDRYDDVYGKLAEYYESREGEPQLLFVESESTWNLRRTRQIPKAKVLSMYDLSIFGEVQLRLQFDDQERVSDTLFVGD